MPGFKKKNKIFPINDTIDVNLVVNKSERNLIFERDFTTVAGAATNSTSLKFGGNGTTSRVLNGEIPVARVYNRELSADEILQNFNSLKNRFNI